MTDMKCIPSLSFKRSCTLNATSNESALIHFVSGKLCSHENLMPVWNLIPLMWTYSKSMCFHFFFYCTSWHCLSESSLQLMFFSAFTSCNSENKITYSAQVRLHCVLLKKNNFCIMNKTKLVWFYSYTEKKFFE